MEAVKNAPSRRTSVSTRLRTSAGHRAGERPESTAGRMQACMNIERPALRLPQRQIPHFTNADAMQASKAIDDFDRCTSAERRID